MPAPLCGASWDLCHLLTIDKRTWLQNLQGCRARLAGAVAGRLAPLVGGDEPVVDDLLGMLVHAIRVELMLPLQLLMFERAEPGTADIDWTWFLGLELPVVQVRLALERACMEHSQRHAL